MAKRVLISIGAAVLLFLLFVASRPSTFTITRSAVISAPDHVLFTLVSNFERWRQWSPWEDRDPQMKREYQAATSTQGPAYAWTGNEQVGAGRMTIVDNKPPTSITIKLEFLKPFESTNTTTFAFAPKNDAIEVTWTMTGHANFLTKLYTVFVNMDKAVGADFEAGLAKLKQVAEIEAARLKQADAGGPVLGAPVPTGGPSAPSPGGSPAVQMAPVQGL